MNAVLGLGREYNNYSLLFNRNSSAANDLLNGISFSELNMIKVGAYNNVIKAADNTDNKSILRRTVSLTETTSSVRKLLKDTGISIEKDNTLKIDAEKFKKADLSALKSVFTGKLSYTDRVAGTAAAMVNIASNKINSLSGRLYNHTGSYYKSNYSTKIDKAV